MRLVFIFTLFHPNKHKRAAKQKGAFLVSHKQKSQRREKSYGENLLPTDRIFSSLQIRNSKTLDK